MKKMGYDLRHGEGLNFGKGRRSLLRNFCQKGSLQITMIIHAGGWDTLHPHCQQRFNSKTTNQFHRIPPHPPSGDSDVSVGVMFKNLTVNMTSSSQLEPAEATDEKPWAQQLDLQWEKRFELRDPPTEDNCKSTWVVKITLSPSL